MNEHKPVIEICLSLGANLGDRLASLCAARDALAPLVHVTACSGVYESQAAYATDQPRFLNAVVRATTQLEPMALLYTLRDIEHEVGRRPTFHYGPRVIDIDIIFYGDSQIDLPELIVPHKRMAERDFVLKPLADVAADWVHPRLGQTVAQLLAALPTGPDEVKKVLDRL